MGGVSRFTPAELTELATADAEIDKPKRGRPFQEHVGVRALQSRRYRAKKKAASRLASEHGANNITLTA